MQLGNGMSPAVTTQLVANCQFTDQYSYSALVYLLLIKPVIVLVSFVALLVLFILSAVFFPLLPIFLRFARMFGRWQAQIAFDNL